MYQIPSLNFHKIIILYKKLNIAYQILYFNKVLLQWGGEFDWVI